jgi:putative pyruvate formate lyase activating enzyme
MPLIDRARLEAAHAWATAQYHRCEVCAERCGVDRYAGPSGTCGLGVEARVYKEYLHFGEERRLVPSHTIYLTGCSFRCAFCSDKPQVDAPLAHGLVIPPAALALRIAQRRREGARNVNFVGGVPDVNLRYILDVLLHVPADTHVVWNTNHWTTPEAMSHLAPIVGTWLSDLKFGNDACARKLAQVRQYWDTVTALLLPVPSSRLLLRHLLMPGHLDCCTIPALRWIAEHKPEAPVNLMTGYLPFHLARTSSLLSRRIPTPEVEAALAFYASLPLADRLLDGVEWSP